MPDAKPLTIFFSVGEPSGDLHGANLIRQLQSRCPGLRAVGYGGPKMAEAGCQLHTDLTALAVMWIARVLVNLHKFWGLVSRADRYFRHHRPDAVVLIDYPGFNWWIARRAKAHGIPVFYYCPPQIWAWARWRVNKMRRFVDHVLCSLPFEESWFRQHGCNATFVGHPFFDEVRRYPYDEQFIAQHQPGKGDSPHLPERPSGCCAQMGTVPFSGSGPLVVILPGSRTQEVTHNLKWFLKAAALIHEKVPNVRFALAAFKPHQAEIARRMIAQQTRPDVAEGTQPDAASTGPIEICVGKTPELMRLADCAMSVSGSVSLELLYHTTPTVVLYWVNRFGYFIQGFFRKVKYITLVNLLANGGLEEGSGFRVQDSVLFPEYLTCEDKSAQIAGHVIEWLSDPAKRAARVEALARLKEKVAHGGASSRAAEYILAALAQRPKCIPRPHFTPIAIDSRCGVGR